MIGGGGVDFLSSHQVECVYTILISTNYHYLPGNLDFLFGFQQIRKNIDLRQPDWKSQEFLPEGQRGSIPCILHYLMTTITQCFHTKDSRAIQYSFRKHQMPFRGLVHFNAFGALCPDGLVHFGPGIQVQKGERGS